jgi:predicted phosphodiesterase
MPRRDVTEAVKQQILDMRRSTAYTDGEIGAKLGLSRGTVVRYGKGARGDDPRRFLAAGHPGRAAPAPPPTPQPARGGTGAPKMPRSVANAPKMPASHRKTREPYHVAARGAWLILSDVHVPYHDEQAVEAAIEWARENYDVRGVLINGDMMDMFRATPFYREPLAGGMKVEFDVAREFVGYLRWHFPDAEMVYRAGNHEERWARYLVSHAPEAWGMEELTIPHQLRFERHKIAWVADKRIVVLGKLPTLHGHELARGRGVNPARYAWLKASETCLVGHWHQASQHPQRKLMGGQIMCWSVGCLCELGPDYEPYGQANHGFAVVTVEAGGDFTVVNKTIRDGRVE